MQSSAPADVAVDDRLCLALHAAARAMDTAYRPMLEKLGLTYPQYLVMSVLWEDGTQRVGELARRLAIDSSTLSPLLKRLESRGLLVRHRDADDERRVLVGLTEAGLRTRQASPGITRRVCAATGLPDDEIADFVTRLHDLAAALQSPAPPA